MIQQVTFSEESLIALRSELLDWFQENGRHWIPWKLRVNRTQPMPGEVIDPYPIWVAEVMLQQTQLKTVLPYWEKWMETFPTLVDLANADEQEVLLIWQGLGYYLRARRLHQAAIILLDSMGCKQSLDPHSWPKDLESWLALPGIGRSTAGSIISSAFDSPSSILDGNVKRIFARLIGSSKPLSKDKERLWNLSEQFLDRELPRQFNQALMDLGAMVCTSKKPRCEICPFKRNCIAYSSKQPANFPVKDLKKYLPVSVIGIGVVLNADGDVLIDQRLNDGLLGGMWEFPGGKQEIGESIEITIKRELREELAIEVEVQECLIVLDHAYSHMKLHFVVHICKWIAGVPQPLASQQVKWIKPEELFDYPFPAANTKIIGALLKHISQETSQ